MKIWPIITEFWGNHENLYIYVFGILNIQCPITIFRDEKTKKRMLKYSQQWRGKCQKLINQSQPSIWLEVSTRPKCPRKMTVSTANRDLTTTHENWSNHACEFKQLHKHKVVRKTWGYILQSVFQPGHRTDTRPNMAKQHTMKMAEQSKISPGWISINRCKISSTIWNINCWKQHVFSYKTLVSRTLNKIWRSGWSLRACLRWSSHIFSNGKVKQVAESCSSNQNPLFEVIQQGKLEMEPAMWGNSFFRSQRLLLVFQHLNVHPS